MATCQCDTGFSTCMTCASQDAARNGGCEFIHGPAQDGDGDSRMSTHRIDITDRIGCRNLAKLKGIINDRREEVGGAQQGSSSANINGCCIIATTVPHQ